jgi:F-type H+-transporting ATPase subunit b
MRARSILLRALVGAVLATFATWGVLSWAQEQGGDLHEQAGAEHGAADQAGAHEVGGHEGGGHEAGGHEAGGHGPGAINWTDFSNKKQPPFLALIINFSILVFVYYKYGKEPVAKALVDRRDGIAKEIEEAQRLRKEAEDRAKVYQAKLASLETELDAAKKALVGAGEGERARLMKEAEEKAERMRKDAVFRLEQELKELRADLQREAVERATAMAAQLLRERVTPDDQRRLGDEYLASLDAMARDRTASGGRAS